VLLSSGFAEGRAAGMVLKALQAGELELRIDGLQLLALHNGEQVAQSAVLADEAACQQALEAVRELAAE
ncbi:MAG: tryptophan--tRNA ligase, partial [Thiopseudomonas sp.]